MPFHPNRPHLPLLNAGYAIQAQLAEVIRGKKIVLASQMFAQNEPAEPSL